MLLAWRSRLRLIHLSKLHQLARFDDVQVGRKTNCTIYIYNSGKNTCDEHKRETIASLYPPSLLYEQMALALALETSHRRTKVICHSRDSSPFLMLSHAFSVSLTLQQLHLSS